MPIHTSGHFSFMALTLTQVGWLTTIYGGLLFIGGGIGYMKRGSKISLAMGSLFGSLFLASGNSMFEGHTSFFYADLCGSLILATVMAKRFLASGKFMPAGLVSFLSATMALMFFWNLR